MLTLRRQIELESVFLISVVAAASFFFVVWRNDNYQSRSNIASGMSSMPIPAEAITSKITISSQISPDGTKKVIMNATQNSDNTLTYDISVSDGDGTSEQFIFTKTIDSSKSMTIPFNTWSPDNKYFFIAENAGNNKKIFVFEAKGALFASEPYLDATDLFKKQNTGSSFDEVTGWASESLIIINTKKSDGEKGFSYWFEVPSKAIIQLSTEF